MDVIRRRIMNHNPYTSQGVLKNTYRNVNAECQELAKYVEIKNTYASSIEFWTNNSVKRQTGVNRMIMEIIILQA